jgi:hypothetical protein
VRIKEEKTYEIIWLNLSSNSNNGDLE